MHFDTGNYIVIDSEGWEVSTYYPVIDKNSILVKENADVNINKEEEEIPSHISGTDFDLKANNIDNLSTGPSPDEAIFKSFYKIFV